MPTFIFQPKDEHTLCPYGICDGSGVVSTDEDDGEGHTMRGVGERPCLCNPVKSNGVE